MAGVGDVDLGDEGFGVEVAGRLAREGVPDWVRVTEVGMRAVQLARELLDGYETTILVEASRRGAVPGTVHLIEPGRDRAGGAAADIHSLGAATWFALRAGRGAELGRVLIVGCEPARTEGRGLSDAAARGVDEALEVIRDLIGRMSRGQPEPGAAGREAGPGSRHGLGQDAGR